LSSHLSHRKDAQDKGAPRGRVGKLPPVPEAPPDCIFCKIVAGELPAEVIDSDEQTVAFMDINPATPGHALVVPRTHSENLFEVSENDLHATITATRRLAERMRETIKPDGINVLNSCGRAAWQSVFHFHLHVIPRYKGDPLELPWLPRPADPAELARVAAELRR
jgi:histidine triad (HIT) family protein